MMIGTTRTSKNASCRDNQLPWPRSLELNVTSQTAQPISIELHMHPSNNMERKVCSNGQCHMNKMDALPMYGKILQNHFAQNCRLAKHYQINANDDCCLSLT